MKYYSEVTEKVYDTPEELNKDEVAVKEAEAKKKAEQEKAANERKARAAAVDAARKDMIAAQQKYRDTLEAFCRDFGTYHRTLSVGEIPTLFDNFFSLF